MIIKFVHLIINNLCKIFFWSQVGKQAMTKPGENIPFYKTVLLASAAGAAGGFVGTPADMINVRMQNDVKLPVETRRKYVF